MTRILSPAIVSQLEEMLMGTEDDYRAATQDPPHKDLYDDRDRCIYCGDRLPAGQARASVYPYCSNACTVLAATEENRK